MNSNIVEFQRMFLDSFSNDWLVANKIAVNPNTPEFILNWLARQICQKGKHMLFAIVRTEIIKNPNISIETIEFLVNNSPGKEVKQTASRSNRVPTYLLEKLSKDQDEITRTGVAGNLNTPFNTLEELTEDSNENVRIAVVENPNTPEYILEKLGKDPRPLVKYALAKKPGTPQFIKYRKENNLPL